MRTLLTTLALAAALNMGCWGGGLDRCSPWTTVLDGVTLAAGRAFAHDGTDQENWSILTVLINQTAQATNTTLTMVCTGSNDGNTTDYPFQSLAVASGTATSSDLTFSKAISGVDTVMWRVDLGGVPDYECTVDGASGGAGDIVTAYARHCTD